MGRMTRKHQGREAEAEPVYEKSFDLLDLDTSESLWYAVQVPGILPPKRVFHATAVVGHTYSYL